MNKEKIRECIQSGFNMGRIRLDDAQSATLNLAYVYELLDLIEGDLLGSFPDKRTKLDQSPNGQEKISKEIRRFGITTVAQSHGVTFLGMKRYCLRHNIVFSQAELWGDDYSANKNPKGKR
jgi:hypothetical protein